MTEYWTINDLPMPEDSEESLFHTFTNGQARNQYWLPGVICPRCKDWGTARSFPFRCPEALKSHPAIKNGTPIPLDEYKQLSRVVQSEFEKCGIDSKLWMLDSDIGFRPGTKFADQIMEIPCHLKYSFFWGQVGACAIVTKEVKDVFEQEKFTGVVFQEVSLNWVGKFDTDKNIPSWDHMMWWLLDGCLIGSKKDYPGEKHPERFGPLYAMIVWNWAERPDIEKNIHIAKRVGVNYQKRNLANIKVGC